MEGGGGVERIWKGHVLVLIIIIIIIIIIITTFQPSPVSSRPQPRLSRLHKSRLHITRSAAHMLAASCSRSCQRGLCQETCTWKRYKKVMIVKFLPSWKNYEHISFSGVFFSSSKHHVCSFFVLGKVYLNLSTIRFAIHLFWRIQGGPRAGTLYRGHSMFPIFGESNVIQIYGNFHGFP